MRKIAVLCMAAVLLLSLNAVVFAQCKSPTGNEVLVWVGGPNGTFAGANGYTFQVVAGQTGDLIATVGGNFGPASLAISDTFCVVITSSGAIGGTYTPDAAWDCVDIGAGYFVPGAIDADIPCDAAVGELDTMYVGMYFCIGGVCNDSCPALDIDTAFVEVVPSPPAIDVVCIDTAFAEAGVATVTIPFDICNPDPCSDTTCYNYDFTASSNIGGLTGSGSGQVNAAPGDCERVNVVLDASLASEGDTSLICMMAETPCDTAVADDTCYTFLIIVAPAENVPLFSTPVAAILILTLVLMAAGIMRRRALVS